MQKKFLSNLLLVVVLNLIIKPISIFGIDATVQNRVGEAAYGTYFSLLNLTFLFNILLDLGINNFTTKNIAQYPHIVSRYMGKLLSFRLVLFGIYTLVTLGVGFFLGYNQYEFSLLLVLILNQFLATLIAYFRSHFAGLMLFKTESILSVLDRLILILVCGILLYNTGKHSPFKIEWFIWIQTACYLLTALIGFGLIIRKIGLPKITWHWAFARAIIKKSIPYALLFLLMMFYTRMDSVLLERIHPQGKVQAGIYAQGFRLLDACFLFGMLFTNLLFPIFSKQIKAGESVLPLLCLSSNLLIGGSFLLALFCWFNAAWLLQLIYNHDVYQSVSSFQFLMLSFIAMCVTQIFGTLLTANGSLKFLNQSALLGIIVNLALNLIWIPQYGAFGAALAVLVTQSFVSLIQTVRVFKTFKVRLNGVKSVQYCLFVAFALILFLSLDELENQALSRSLQLLGSIGLLFLTKLIDLKELKQVIQQS